MRRLTLALCALLTIASPQWAVGGPFEDGLAAHDEGHPGQAFALWLPLARQGLAPAQFNIAVMYETGRGAAADPAQAAHWYLAAAHQGDVDAQFKAGLLYEAGAGLTRDAAEARFWYDTIVANPRDDPTARLAKQRARQRLAALLTVTREVAAFRGGRFVIVKSQEGACVVTLQGRITDDAAARFERVVARSIALGCDAPWVMLESPGGVVGAGIDLGRAIRRHGLRTMTRYDCASACVDVFLGGVERVLAGSRARVGLHQPAWLDVRSGQRICSTLDDAAIMRRMFEYTAFVVPSSYAQIMEQKMRTSCHGIDWLDGPHALAVGIATALESTDTDLYGPSADAAR